MNKKTIDVVTKDIDALKNKRDNLQTELEEKDHILDEATHCEDFSLINYDMAKNDVVGGVEKTIEERKALLEKLT